MSTPAPFGGDVLIADTSVWRRADRLPNEVRQAWLRALDNEQIATTPPIVAELLYRAAEVSPAEFRRWDERLRALRRNLIPDRSIWAIAFDAYRELAEGSQLLGKSLTDTLVAATATWHGLGVLTYDRDYDQLSALSCMNFDSRWIVPAGSVP